MTKNKKIEKHAGKRKEEKEEKGEEKLIIIRWLSYVQ